MRLEKVLRNYSQMCKDCGLWVQVFDGELLVSAELYVTSRYKLSIAQDVPREL